MGASWHTGHTGTDGPDDIVRDLDEGAHLMARNEPEARDHPRAATNVDPVLSWLEAADTLRDEHGDVDLPAAERTAARPVEPQ
jgi:hypothetical protein